MKKKPQHVKVFESSFLSYISRKVVEFKQPAELKKCMDFSLSDEGADDDELLDLCQRTVKYSVKTGKRSIYSEFLISCMVNIVIYYCCF